MQYLALGDSSNIDLYTGMAEGGAVSQFARLINAFNLVNLTFDGATTEGVLHALAGVEAQPDVVTLTAGGNDLLLMSWQREGRREAVLAEARDSGLGDIMANLSEIAARLAAFRCMVIMNTVYDPTDGDDGLVGTLGLTPAFRNTYVRVNAHIRELAARYHFLLCDLEALFHGHGMAAAMSWITLQIEPNLLGASAIATDWERLYRTKIRG